MKTESKTLAEALPEEIQRCQELLEVYNSIPTGAFAAMHIKASLDKAINATMAQDTVKMLEAYYELQAKE